MPTNMIITTPDGRLTVADECPAESAVVYEPAPGVVYAVEGEAFTRTAPDGSRAILCRTDAAASTPTPPAPSPTAPVMERSEDAILKDLNTVNTEIRDREKLEANTERLEDRRADLLEQLRVTRRILES